MVKQFYFDEVEHKYYDSAGLLYTSMTQVLQKYEKSFNKEYWSVYSWYDRFQPENKVRPDDREVYIHWGSHQFSLAQAKVLIDKSTHAKQYPVILADWDRRAVEAQVFGTNTHNFIENEVNSLYGSVIEREHYTAKIITFGNLSLTYRAQVNQQMLESSTLKQTMPDVYDLLYGYIKDGYALYAEVRMYDEEFLISGTCDIMALKGSKFDLVDWKTNAKRPMFTSGYYKKVWNSDRTEKIQTSDWVNTDKRFKEPISHIQQCKGNGYTLQLSGYAFLLERKGLRCDKLALVHISRNDVEKPTIKDITGAEVIWLPYLKNEIDLMFSNFSRGRKKRFL